MGHFGEHEPHIEKLDVKREAIKCQCGEYIFTDEKFPIGEIDGYIRCKDCGLVYAPISMYRSGQITCYILQGYLCVWCDDLTMKLYKTRREDEEADRCEKCVRKDIEKMPKRIKDWQDILDFAKEQLDIGG